MKDINSLESKISNIDAVLPQTQCGLCGYGGCRPYAKALVADGENINLCPPGGVSTLQKLASLLAQDPEPYIAEMTEKAKPPAIVKIRESECIGCTKCIQACPVDAIVGAAKKMHTIITTDCTGCELCIEPCPVDCIDIEPIALLPPEQRQQQSDYWRERYQRRQARLAKPPQPRKNLATSPDKEETVTSRKAAIQAALERAKQNKDV